MPDRMIKERGVHVSVSSDIANEISQVIASNLPTMDPACVVQQAQPSFYYYNPEPESRHGQHAFFTPHPNEYSQNQMMMVQPQMPQQFAQHSHMQPQMHLHPSDQQNGAQFRPLNAKDYLSTPNAIDSPSSSPQPIHIKPSVFLHGSPALLSLDTNCGWADANGFPSTPPLSTSGSSISSPPSSCGMTNTPVGGDSFRMEGIEGVKEGCETDVELELLANSHWHRSASPEMTPCESLSPQYCVYKLFSIRIFLIVIV